VASEPVKIQQRIKIADDLEIDPQSYELCNSGNVFKLERIPAEILLFLIEKRGQLVTREEIAAHSWGKNVFLDTENSINVAIRKIRHALQDDAEQPRFIQTITGRGYRFIAQAIEPETQTPTSTLLSVVGYRWQLAAVLAVSVFLIALADAWWLRSSHQNQSKPGPDKLILAVLPFENLTGDPAQEYFSDGITEEIITELGSLNPQHLGIIARTSVMFYKHNPKPLDQVRRELGAQYVLEGSVRRNGNRVRVTIQLIQLRDQTHIWARQYDRELGDLLAVQTEIAQQSADEIQRLTLGDQRGAQAERPGAIARPSTSYEAYDLYLKGRYYWNKRTLDGFRQASEYFQKAIDKDPNFARAYAGLADTFALMSSWQFVPQNEFVPKARSAALKALALDESLAETHTSLALIAENFDYDWKMADKEFRRAIQLNPDYATAHQWYAEYLSWQGRFEEALAESEQARQLDPLSLIIAVDHTAILYYSRQYDLAIAQARDVLKMDPSFEKARGLLFSSLIQEGKFAEALHEMESWARIDHRKCWRCLAYLYGRWGRNAQAQQALQMYMKSSPHSSQVNFETVIGFLGTGRTDQVLTLLEQSCSQHSNIVIAIKVDPIYDPLRNDPRFQNLLYRIRLP